MRLLPAATALLSALLLPLSAAYNKTACNNSPSLCNATYSDILHLGAHNVAFVRTAANGWSEGGNQYFNATVALSAGVRLLQSQLHVDNGSVKLCHTTCDILDGGLLKDWLSGINTWLSTRPSEVVTILLVNDDKISAETIGGIFTAAGLDTLAYVPDGTGWPTLQAMIDKKKQVVAFLSNAADTSKVPYLLPEWNYIFETDFEVSDPANYTCYATRPSAVAGKDKLSTAVASGRMGFMNRFLYDQISTTLKLYVPNSTYAAALNGNSGVGNLKDGVAQCSQQWGRQGGFALLDFVNVGTPMDIVDAHNNVTNPENREAFPPNPKDAFSSNKNIYKNGGMAQIRRLAAQVKSGQTVKKSQFIIGAGSWMGTFNIGSV